MHNSVLDSKGLEELFKFFSINPHTNFWHLSAKLVRKNGQDISSESYTNTMNSARRKISIISSLERH